MCYEQLHLYLDARDAFQKVCYDFYSLSSLGSVNQANLSWIKDHAKQSIL